MLKSNYDFFYGTYFLTLVKEKETICCSRDGHSLIRFELVWIIQVSRFLVLIYRSTRDKISYWFALVLDKNLQQK